MSFIREIARFQPKSANIQMATKSTVLKITISNFSGEYSPFLAQPKKYKFCIRRNARFYGGAGEKVGSKLEDCHFPGNQEQFFQFAPEE